jgi:hypothetical protein
MGTTPFSADSILREGVIETAWRGLVYAREGGREEGVERTLGCVFVDMG